MNNYFLFIFPFIFASSFASNVGPSEVGDSKHLNAGGMLEDSFVDLKKYVSEPNKEVLEKILTYVSNPLFYPVLTKLKSLDALKALEEIFSDPNKYSLVKEMGDNNEIEREFNLHKAQVALLISILETLELFENNTNYNPMLVRFQQNVINLIIQVPTCISLLVSFARLKKIENNTEFNIDDIVSDMLKAFILAFKSNTASDLTSSEKELVEKFLEDCDFENKTKGSISEDNTKDTDGEGNTKDNGGKSNFWVYFAIVAVVLILLVALIIYFVLKPKVKEVI